jgi:hypothetical protein
MFFLIASQLLPVTITIVLFTYRIDDLIKALNATVIEMENLFIETLENIISYLL